MTFLLVFCLKGLAVFYLATAFVELAKQVINSMRIEQFSRDDYKRFGRWINRKPFNCVLCMCFWFSIPIWFAPWSPTPAWFDPLTPLYGVPALAGTALLIYTVKTRIGTQFV